MTLLEMFPALVNSVPTTLTGAIGAADTTIYVLDDSRIPEPPNLLVIGENSTLAETVKLVAKDGNRLTVVRGFQGQAKSWSDGTTIARNFTAYDADAFMANIMSLKKLQEEHRTAVLPHGVRLLGNEEHPDQLYPYGFMVDYDGTLIFVYDQEKPIEPSE